MKGVNHGGIPDKIIAINPEQLPKDCLGCKTEFGEGDSTLFLDDDLSKKVHNNMRCIRLARAGA